jgi:hypothetical protein
MSYDMGGEVESQLENMDEKGLAAQAKESSSPSIRRMAQRLLRERQMSKPQGASAMGVQYQAAQPQMPSYAPGGIVAFAQGKTVYGGPSTEADEGEAEARNWYARTPCYASFNNSSSRRYHGCNYSANNASSCCPSS